MALTIATGFVVDDAIVMIENIARYIEEGETPLEAALKGAEQIGFTIISLTISLIAVLIPLLFMGDVVGPAVPRVRDHAGGDDPDLGGRLADADADDVRAAAAPHAGGAAEPLLPRSGRFFDRVIARYGRAAQLGARPPARHAAGRRRHAGADRPAVYRHPEGLLPGAGHRRDPGHHRGAAVDSFAAMAERQQALARVVLQDPAVESLSSFIGVDGTNTTLNSGRMLINLKPHDERSDTRAPTSSRRLQPRRRAAWRASRCTCSRCRT